MESFAQQIARSAERAVAVFQEGASGLLDYSEASLVVLEEILNEITKCVGDLSEEQHKGIVQDAACYIFEVAHREFGGRYCWFDERDQPVLVVGEPSFRVALLAWDKVRGRLSGDRGDNIPFFYSGFAERARRAIPGDDALYV